MMKAFDSDLVLTSKSSILKEAIEKAGGIAQRPKTFIARQLSNPKNIRAQEKTCKEILNEIGA